MAHQKAEALEAAQPEDEAVDMFFITVPLQTYRRLSDAAAKRGLTFAQGLEKAISDFISEKES